MASSSSSSSSNVGATGSSDVDQFYNFPPFFTLQPVESSRDKQIKLWRRLILDHFAKNPGNSNVLTLSSFEKFENPAIQRKLDQKAREAIAQDLISSGHGQWQNAGASLYVFIKTPSEWASIIMSFIESNGLTGTIYTLYEIHSGDLTRNTSIQGVDPALCLSALEILHSSGKAQVFKNDENPDETGVKFL